MAEGVTLGSIFDRYAAAYPRLEGAGGEDIVLARNQRFTGREEAAAEGDEIAFLPPVSGGTGAYTHWIEDEAGGNFYALTREPIDAAKVGRRILRGEDGALVNFEGVVRNNTRGRATRFLDYECYEAMAVKTMAQIGREIAQGYAIGRMRWFTVWDGWRLERRVCWWR